MDPFEAHKGIGMTSQRTRDRLVTRLSEEGINDGRVLAAVSRTPRHLFVDEALASRAYEDTALPIGYGQTISQPYVVARMTEVILAGHEPARVLEVGTGCGYQTTILAQLTEQVYSIERIPELSQRARATMQELRLSNVTQRVGDGWQGWIEQAPFDAIIVTAAPEKVPQALLDQLADGGQLVIPVGEQDSSQRLMLITHNAGQFEEQVLDLVSFVPLVKESK
ncbi:MAG: protein-L-isoaspartate(D-aspartate) O-methyltransferase [Gammaproteobacteria bacterium]|nr:protein-L-isoaspartate(D-aspartate) O-methyltransferase [Gammaproteobacteria bacterium]